MIDNLFSDLPQKLPDELVVRLLNTAHVRIEKIVSLGMRHPRVIGTTKISMSGLCC